MADAKKVDKIKSKIIANPAVSAFVAKGDKDFLTKHLVQKYDDINGNGDDVFCGSNVTYANRFPHHGYDKDQDSKVYEAEEQKPHNLIRHIASLQIKDNTPEEPGDKAPEPKTLKKKLQVKRVVHEGKSLKEILGEDHVEKAIFDKHHKAATEHANLIVDLLKDLKKHANEYGHSQWNTTDIVKNLSSDLEHKSEHLARHLEQLHYQYADRKE